MFSYTLYQNNFFQNIDYLKLLAAIGFGLHYFHRCFIYPFRCFSMSDSNILVASLAFGFTFVNGYLNAKFLTTESINQNQILFFLGLILFIYGFFLLYIFLTLKLSKVYYDKFQRHIVV